VGGSDGRDRPLVERNGEEGREVKVGDRVEIVGDGMGTVVRLIGKNKIVIQFDGDTDGVCVQRKLEQVKMEEEK
jgi:dsDNA-specific endonuclease/ATPase MutS2